MSIMHRSDCIEREVTRKRAVWDERRIGASRQWNFRRHLRTMGRLILSVFA